MGEGEICGFLMNGGFVFGVVQYDVGVVQFGGIVVKVGYCDGIGGYEVVVVCVVV